MIQLSLAIWISFFNPNVPTTDAILPAGSYPVGLILSCLKLVDSTPIELKDPKIAGQAIHIPVPIVLSHRSFATYDILFRRAGVMVEKRERAAQKPGVNGEAVNESYYHVSNGRAGLQDSSSPKRLKLKILHILHVDAGPLAESIKDMIAKNEADWPESERTSLVQSKARGSGGLGASIIIRYYRADYLQLYLDFIKKEDVSKSDSSQISLVHYECRYVRSKTVRLHLLAQWKAAEFGELTVVPQKSSNILLIGVQQKHKPRLLDLVKKLDRPQLK